jgi:[acyl-carrier-protein] S-malonyltransferase
MDMTSTAFVFPGQGSQAVGMGRALAEAYPAARETFDEADDILGFRLSELCFEGSDDKLTLTENAQPALFTAGIAALRAIQEALDEPITPAYAAGHSLGEFTALTAAGAMRFEDGLRLVRRRGELMRDAGADSPGGMAAILGLDVEQIDRICATCREESGGTVVVANDNCPGQVVIAGDDAALEQAIEEAKVQGARRAVRLAVSIACHTSLMAKAQAAFDEALQDTIFTSPLISVVGNTQAKPLATIENIRAELSAQLTSVVCWTDSVRYMLANGITDFVELGSKNVLTGLLRRIDRSAAGHVVDAPEGVEALWGLLAG